jgi:hypothetical protein
LNLGVSSRERLQVRRVSHVEFSVLDNAKINYQDLRFSDYQRSDELRIWALKGGVLSDT